MSPIKAAHLFFDRLNRNQNGPGYDRIIEKLLPGERISVFWDTNLWENIGIKNNIQSHRECIVSSQGRYMAICLQTKGANPVKLLVFAVHLPHKSGRQRARDLLTKAATDLVHLHKPQAVAIVGDFNIQFDARIHYFFPDFIALFFQRPTTERGGRIDNVLVNQYLASHVANYDKEIHDECGLFTHYPIHVHQPY